MVGSVRVQGRGQHRRLVVSLEDLESSADEEEQLRMVWALPASAYCDLDELRRRTSWPRCLRDFRVEGDGASAVDIEGPEYRATPHELTMDWTVGTCAFGAASFEVPLHVRYLTPREGGGVASSSRVPVGLVPPSFSFRGRRLTIASELAVDGPAPPASASRNAPTW